MSDHPFSSGGIDPNTPHDVHASLLAIGLAALLMAASLTLLF